MPRPRPRGAFCTSPCKGRRLALGADAMLPRGLRRGSASAPRGRCGPVRGQRHRRECVALRSSGWRQGRRRRCRGGDRNSCARCRRSWSGRPGARGRGSCPTSAGRPGACCPVRGGDPAVAFAARHERQPRSYSPREGVQPAQPEERCPSCRGACASRGPGRGGRWAGSAGGPVGDFRPAGRGSRRSSCCTGRAPRSARGVAVVLAQPASGRLLDRSGLRRDS
mmetsp:Transcript_14717/g.55475  ORF Transcript_14717/g.55475 Transcript_14717/m.55475 type:complete len:223 (+) Transcript_14717:1784-2452(+)